MKKLFVAITVAFALTGTAFASNASIAVVDAAKILQTSSKVKSMSNALRQRFTPRQDKIKKSQAALSSEMQKLQRDTSVMTKKDKKALETKIMAERKALYTEVAKFQSDVNKAQSESMKKISDQLRQVIANVAKSDNIDMVVDKQITLYANGVKDITDQVSNKFNNS